MQFRDRIEAYLALQIKNESERELSAALLALYDKGLVECKWDDDGELCFRSTPKELSCHQASTRTTD
jgi:hypothetical protein